MINTILFSCIVIIDRLTKLLVISHCHHEYIISRFCSLHLTFNQGISWSIGSQRTSSGSFSIIFIVSTFIALFALYTWRQKRAGFIIRGEILVLAGALSNLLDRFLYPGVIDFIGLHWGKVTWPLFNIADIAILAGASIMLIGTFTTKRREGKLHESPN
ncbi:MAG: signal peptidase II [Candidatus Babeliaceae bacterium]|nr:signal peptidase II [Candidatus Babeliaceae bacterium]